MISTLPLKEIKFLSDDYNIDSAMFNHDDLGTMYSITILSHCADLVMFTNSLSSLLSSRLTLLHGSSEVNQNKYNFNSQSS